MEKCCTLGTISRVQEEKNPHIQYPKNKSKPFFIYDGSPFLDLWGKSLPLFIIKKLKVTL